MQRTHGPHRKMRNVVGFYIRGRIAQESYSRMGTEVEPLALLSGWFDSPPKQGIRRAGLPCHMYRVVGVFCYRESDFAF